MEIYFLPHDWTFQHWYNFPKYLKWTFDLEREKQWTDMIQHVIGNFIDRKFNSWQKYVLCSDRQSEALFLDLLYFSSAQSHFVAFLVSHGPISFGLLCLQCLNLEISFLYFPPFFPYKRFLDVSTFQSF